MLQYGAKVTVAAAVAVHVMVVVGLADLAKMVVVMEGPVPQPAMAPRDQTPGRMDNRTLAVAAVVPVAVQLPLLVPQPVPAAAVL